MIRIDIKWINRDNLQHKIDESKYCLSRTGEVEHILYEQETNTHSFFLEGDEINEWDEMNLVELEDAGRMDIWIDGKFYDL